MKKPKTKGLALLGASKSIGERAAAYFKSTKRDIEDEVLKPLQKKIEKIDDEIFDLEDLNLNTDLNKGFTKLTQADVKERFTDIINKKYERELLQLELDSKTEVFNSYFVEEEAPAEEEAK